jgi:hypothetical protein
MSSTWQIAYMCLKTYADVGFDDYGASKQLQLGKWPYKEKVDRSAFAIANMACGNYFVTEAARLVRQARGVPLPKPGLGCGNG